ncbi:hypothetical protein AJ80_06149 [Polytolypa hystricis UAMH7299]|uniref:Regulatory P domain-containing protein n=1 Tax=Polytolypa hystricis (strain UAMH7299) TaxID=1447883 RepID=A0A2B7XXX4_POLH7|nr:hypothetical protein AJ80_06149 [Polytolypa hystricis UAMH7299]
MKVSLWLLLAAAGTAVSLEARFSVKMDHLMALKTASWNKLRKTGGLRPGKHHHRHKVDRCIGGKAAGEYACENVDLHSFIPHSEMGAETGNDVWGWTAPNGREFGAVGQNTGTAFVEVLRNGDLKYLGRLNTQTEASEWRDVKVLDGYVYIGSEAPGHGLQIFDMRKLLKVRGKPKTFDIEMDVESWFSGFGSSHNVVVHEESKTVYVVGTSREETCQGGLYMLDVTDPKNPIDSGCVNQDGYVHDAQCVTYKGPDKKYTDRIICFNYNEDALTIVDVTDKSAPVQISKTTYFGSAYTHQGWIATEDMSYLLLDDEFDELNQTGNATNQHTTTYIFNIADLANPQHTGLYQSPARSIDHNQYVVDGLSYQANYCSGLRIVDVSSIKRDPTGAGFKQVGFFDVHPEDDEVGGVVDFLGSWSVYPFFPSGYLLLNSIERGIYSLKYTGPE